jgi:integrase
MTKIRLKYVHEFRDRHGKVRRYARLPRRPKVSLPGLPGSAEFMDVYQAALAGEAPRVEIGASRTKPGTVDAAVVSLYGSVSFVNLAPATQRMRRNVYERFRRDHGDKRIALLQRRHIADMVAAKAAEAPAAARNFLHIIRALMQHCQSIGMIDDDPTIGIKAVKVRSGGIVTWLEADIAKFEAKHPVGSRARLALALLLYTAQRRSDVIRMGRQHIRDGAIHLTQRKTGAALAIPIHQDLAAVIDATPSQHLTFLVTRDGSPFADAGFGNLFREWCNEAGLPKQCSAHGLRKAACRRLAEAGCSALEIMSISGHASLREVQRYCAAADQARMAGSAMATVTMAFQKPENGSNREQKLANQGAGLAKSARKPLNGNG